MRILDQLFGRKYLEWDEYQKIIGVKEQEDLNLRLKKRELMISK